MLLGSEFGEKRRLVEEEPVVAELLRHLDELVEVHGLDDVTVDAQLVALGDIPFLPGRGQDDHRDGAGAQDRPGSGAGPRSR